MQYDYVIQYYVVLDVYGPMSTAQWYLDDPTMWDRASKKIPNGVRWTFSASVVLTGPDHASLHLSGATVVYVKDTTDRKYSLPFADGGLTVKKSDCRT